MQIELTASFADVHSATYYRYELCNVKVTHYAISGSGEAGSPAVEEFRLGFEEIRVIYTDRDPTGQKVGNIEYGWKVEEPAGPDA